MNPNEDLVWVGPNNEPAPSPAKQDKEKKAAEKKAGDDARAQKKADEKAKAAKKAEEEKADAETNAKRDKEEQQARKKGADRILKALDLYEVLGITPRATDAEIKKGYREQ